MKGKLRRNPLLILWPAVILLVMGLQVSPVNAAECSAHCECELLQEGPDPGHTQSSSVFIESPGGGRWAYIEYSIDGSGHLKDVRERFASAPGRGKELLEKSRRGSNRLDFGSGRYEVFSFERPEGASPSRGRKLSLRNQGILTGDSAKEASGEIAIRLETGASGALQVRDILFASDPALGTLAPDLADLLEIKNPGASGESALDVAFFKVQDGQVDTLTLTSYIPR